MCGIAGIAGKNVAHKASLVKTMTDSLRHRGPDGEGIWVAQNCVLGHRRLSIIDLSSGAQPMSSASGKRVITFNGEIYGFQSIKQSLKEYRFVTNSDTEVVLALYEKYGLELFGYLPGMFSFGLWDEEEQTLICGRDRFGEKPFYYSITPAGELIFASEIKALFKSEQVDARINPDSLVHYLQRLYVHPHTSIYQHIQVLPPAHYLVFKDGKAEVRRYWNLPGERGSIGLGEASETFRQLFLNSVEKQLVADVPVGCFLSGGIDSSLVVAAASTFREKLTTISFGFGQIINELPFAREVSRKYNTEHVEIQQPLPDLGDLLMKMQEIYDEPFADSSNIPTYLISKAASQHLKVVLTGDGGDELLGGYMYWYRNLVNIEKRKLMATPMRMILSISSKVAAKLNNRYIPYLHAQQALLARGERSISFIHHRQNEYFTQGDLNNIGLSAGNGDLPKYSFKPMNSVSDAMLMDVENYMPGDILVKTDRASMANSLELRAPFLDKELAEFCISLPYRLKLTYKQEKIVARKAFDYALPENIKRRHKQGFGAPVVEWLKTSSLAALKSDYLCKSNSRIYDFLDYRKSQSVVKSDSYQTWILLVLAMWFEKSYKG